MKPLEVYVGEITDDLIQIIGHELERGFTKFGHEYLTGVGNLATAIGDYLEKLHKDNGRTFDRKQFSQACLDAMSKL